MNFWSVFQACEYQDNNIYLLTSYNNSLLKFVIEGNNANLDYIYDYFEPSIKSMQSDSSYEWYRKLQIAINKLLSVGV